MTKFELFCGMSKPNGIPVGQNHARAFLAKEVAPAFQGFTFQFVEGYWEQAREETLVITFVLPEERRQDVAAIANAYARRFDQDCALVTETAVSAGFVLQATTAPVPLS
jgi:hypothetical protein